MPKIKVNKVDQISRTTVSYALDNFMYHCKPKNLSPYQDVHFTL